MTRSGESRVWQAFHADFKALATEEAAIVRAETKDLYLRAYADYRIAENLPCGYWRLSDGPSEGLKARYEALATRAGLKLRPPQGTLPLNFWLHRLFRNLLENKSRSHLFAAQKDEGGMILFVCEASATFCSRLETETINTSFGAGKQGADVAALRPTRRPPESHKGDSTATLKAPDRALESFLGALPTWQRKVLEWDFDAMTQEEQQAWQKPPASQAEYLEMLKLQDTYYMLVRGVPAKLRVLKRRMTKSALKVLPAGTPGRPRKDALAEEALRLKLEGKSWAQVGLQLGVGKESIRKLATSRQQSPPEKTRP